jgi:thioredoxin 1
MRRAVETCPGERREESMTNPALRTFDDTTFDAEVLGAPGPVLVEFGAAWCGPCKALAPIVEKIATERAGRLAVGVVDVDESPSVATRFGVRGVPTLIVFAGGKEVARQVGVTSHAKLGQIVDRATG